MKKSLRTKNRIREHQDHGWKPIAEMDGYGTFFPGERVVLLDCPCGWIGWLNRDELDERR